MSVNLTVWADGFGVWHARVPLCANRMELARTAIRREIQQRSAPGARFRVRVELDDTADYILGTVVYKEAV